MKWEEWKDCYVAVANVTLLLGVPVVGQPNSVRNRSKSPDFSFGLPQSLSTAQRSLNVIQPPAIYPGTFLPSVEQVSWNYIVLRIFNFRQV